ncbi:serine proteinase [Pseudoalteromonas byunsanensis]|uniref:Serine proteinase n=2 Tax=Pseudoalteromonas byunsanensis TaxID=327939 RepID=A0A1S1NCX8_9GAMM|nr:serine proteinase [Pseudoalteromonas byunsanensis]
MLVSLSLPLAATANIQYRSAEIVVAGPVTDSSVNVLAYYPKSKLSIVSVTRGKELEKAKEMRLKGRLAHVNVLVNKFAISNDPYLSYQWNWQNIEAFSGWDVNIGGTSTVAVLDTGLAGGGSDGIGCVVAPYNVYDPTIYPEDGDGHGTHVSGTIAQSTNNGIGVAGLAYGACIMPVKVLDDSGSGNMAAIVEGIYHAVDSGADVINLSLGVSARYRITSDPILDPALDYAASKGVVVVAASGNDGSRRNISYPASHSSVIAVGATDANDQVTRYSNRGDMLDLVAPGGDTSVDSNGDGYADGILQETKIGGSWGYYFFQGTSMATPHVAALSAMLISNGTASTPMDVKTAMQQSAKDLYDAGWDKASGSGLINVSAALNWQPGVVNPPSMCTDVDGDGVCVEAGDCDDNDASVYPNANDTRGKKGRDGIDNDCNGIVDG